MAIMTDPSGSSGETALDLDRLQRVAAAVNYDNGSAIQMARYSHDDVKWLVAELAERTVDVCDHGASSGDEGPIVDLPGGWPVRWRCDGCGAIRYDDDALATLRTELRDETATSAELRRQLAGTGVLLGAAEHKLRAIRDLCDRYGYGDYKYGDPNEFPDDIRAALGATGTEQGEPL